MYFKRIDAKPGPRFLKLISVRSATILLVFGVLAMTACTPAKSGTTTSTPLTTRTMTANPVSIIQSTGPNLPDIVSVVEKVRPSVVAINDQVSSTSIFGGTSTQAAAGSGWIIDSDGIIVTNDHVISGAQNIVISLNDGRILTAESVASDPVNDLAIIKVNATGLPAVTVGDSSKLQVGMQVLAIGNALGEGIRVTGGLVSNLGTSISFSSTQTLYNLVETDAAINPGNSGGALVNMAGEVVGIVNAKVSASGIEGMGYAISVNSALPVLQQLISQGHAVLPWIGLVFQTVDPGVAMVYGLSADTGVLITDVASSSPGEAAGFQPGDIIMSIGGKAVTTASEAADAVNSSSIGQILQIAYQRNSSKATASVTVEQNPTQ